MKLKYYTFLFGTLFSLAIGHHLLAQQAATITTAEPRPLRVAARALEEKYNWRVTYEDPPYGAQEVLAPTTPGKSFVLLKAAPATFQFNQPANPQDRNARAQVVSTILAQHAAIGTSGSFQAVHNGDFTHIVPVSRLDETGAILPYVSMLQTNVTFPFKDMSVGEIVAIVLDQNFDGLANGTILNTLGGVTYSASLGSPIVTSTFLTTTSPNGLGSTSAGYFEGSETATFTFASGITAFGIDVNTYAPTAGDYSATINLGDVVLSKFDVFPGAATGQFIGFVSDTPFTSVTISSLVDPSVKIAYTYTLDTLVYGDKAAVVTASAPEPPAGGMMGLALMVAGVAVRRRRAGKSR